MTKHYEFLLNGEAIDLRQAIEAVGGDPHITLLQWLRATGRTGTKEGCAEGECGACAVVVRRIEAGQASGTFEAVNSCILPLLALEGAEVTSVEGVSPRSSTPNDADGALHPVQRALVERGGSQCGYCTPGFVMGLFTEYYRPGREGFDPACVSGNLCRCTGYRPILEAGRSLPLPEASDPRLAELRRPGRVALSVVYENSGRHFVRPTSWQELWDALDRFPEHTLIHGGTDLMVYANQRYRRYPVLISLEGLAELRELHFTEEFVSLGAGASLSRIDRWL
ncbi:MAG TPA: 2Fe-2S iron-sulfur cluster-binding protein, partial [Polyangiaceae bacterium]|nr:2Fe-2S iron-sulfur cluster-binding protein [Polyangiaceae bacterium]